MKSLYLRIYLTVVAVLLLFAAGSGWFFQRQMDEERGRAESMQSERMGAWAELIQGSLPAAYMATSAQAEALRDWSSRLRMPLALDDAAGVRIGESESYARLSRDRGIVGAPVRLEDGRTLWIMRPGLARRLSGGSPGPHPRHAEHALPMLPGGPRHGFGMIIGLAVLFVAVAAGAYPVVRRLTRRLETLKSGVEQFGAGQLHRRIEVGGDDEVAAVASSFNVAAGRIEALVRSHQSLLANASHELRSPLARMRMAVSMLDDAGPGERARLRDEIDTNVAELDALVEEVLLASRLDAAPRSDRVERVDLLGLAAEEAAHFQAEVDGSPAAVNVEERLLRRALRNLLENARRYGGGEIEVSVEANAGRAEIRVCDRGTGVPPEMRERIFEPFFRLPGHAERAGGVGLGLSLVRQIAQRHDGSVRCEARPEGGSCFVLSFPLA